MKKIIIFLVLFISMFAFTGCVPPVTENPDPDPIVCTLPEVLNEAGTTCVLPVVELSGPEFTGVNMAVGTERTYIETTLLSAPLRYSSPTIMNLGFSINSLTLLTSETDSSTFEGTIINGVYVSTKGNQEYLVIDVTQTADLSDSYTFNNIVVGSNGWETDKIFTLGSKNNKFYTSDDLTKIYIPVNMSVDVSTTQEFTIKSIKYLDGVEYKDVRYAVDAIATIDILVAGNTIEFRFVDPFDEKYGETSVVFDHATNSVSMHLTNLDNLAITEIQINNQVAYTSETYTFGNSGDVIIPIPSEVDITTYNWVKVRVTYSLLESVDIPSEYTTISEVFLATDEGLVYDESDTYIQLGKTDYLIRIAADLMVFGSDYYERLELYIVNDIDLTGLEFEPLNTGGLGLLEVTNYSSLKLDEEQTWTIHVDPGFVFVNTDVEYLDENSLLWVDGIAFDNLTYVNLNVIMTNYNAYETTYFGDYINNIHKR